MNSTIRILKWPLSCRLVFIACICSIIHVIHPAIANITYVAFYMLPLSSILLCCALFIFVFVEHGLSQITNACSLYFKLLFLVSILMLFSTLIGYPFSPQYYKSSQIIADGITIIFYMSGIVFAPLVRHKYIRKTFFWSGIIALVYGVIALFLIDFTLLNREINSWKPQYILWGGLNIWPALFIMNILGNKNDMSKTFPVVSIIVTLLYFILGLLFMKRVVLVEAAIVIMLLTYKLKFFQKIKIAIFIVLIIILSLWGLNASGINLGLFFEATYERFLSIDAIKNFDRIVEFINVMDTFNTKEHLIGRGLGGIHYGLGWEHVNLHIGWLNYIFKGGLVFLFVQIVVTIAIAKRFFSKRNDVETATFSTTSLFFLIIICISTLWGTTPTVIMFSIVTFATLNA